MATHIRQWEHTVQHDDTPGLADQTDNLLRELKRATKIVARRRRLTDAEADDLTSELWIKLRRNNWTAIRNFQSRSTLLSYLVTVADRCTIDLRIKECGKWRPRKRTVASGPLAVALERLTSRDGRPLHEAVAALESLGGDPAQLKRLAASTVTARRGRRWTDLGPATNLACGGPTPYEAMESRRMAIRLAHLRRALRSALAQLSEDDRRLLDRRFSAGHSVANIAREQREDPKHLYRKYERLCGHLRGHLNEQGFTSAGA